MKMTKDMKEYITKKVREKIETKYTQSIKNQEENNKKIEGFHKQLRDKVFAYIEAEHIQFAQENHFSINDKIVDRGYYRLPCIEFNFEDDNIHRKIAEETKSKAEDICFTLSLGGKKEDLDKLLSEI